MPKIKRSTSETIDLFITALTQLDHIGLSVEPLGLTEHADKKGFENKDFCIRAVMPLFRSDHRTDEYVCAFVFITAIKMEEHKRMSDKQIYDTLVSLLNTIAEQFMEYSRRVSIAGDEQTVQSIYTH